MKLCPVCSKSMSYYDKGTYYGENHQLFYTSFYYCNACDTFAREVDESHIKSHLNAASYTNLKRQDLYYQQRAGYFDYLFKFFKKYAKSNPVRWCDFGSSYGHFVEYLSNQGIECHGIELNKELVLYCNNNGRLTFQGFGDILDGEKYGVISFIDSLYMPENPKIILQQAKKHLETSGYLILRITNRNWLAHFRTKVLRKDLGNSLGAVTTGFSQASILRLLREEGFEIVKLSSVERGKSLPMTTKGFYAITEALYHMTFGLVNICPGIIVIAKMNNSS